MLQLLQYQKNGDILIEDIPAPQCVEGGVLVRVAHSVVSAGTERTSVTKAQSNIIDRIRKQPEAVQTVLESIKRDGISATLRKVQGVLDAYRPLGYSIAGEVIESRCAEFKPGDRVACAGNTYAYHAEIITAPKNLTVRLPEHVATEHAAYTTIGAIALQGIRQAEPHFGEVVVVIGLGIIGLLTVQMLRSAGCRVVGIEPRADLRERAKRCGAEAVFASNGSCLKTISSMTNGIGADAVLITASTGSNQPVEIALSAVRKRGRVVIVGAVAMDIPRSPFYEKEVQFTIACSYGPGRYDPLYEEKGIDYPPHYVRWSEQRNMEHFVQLLASGAISTEHITTHVFPILDAAQAYQLITAKESSKDYRPYCGIVLSYPQRENTMPVLFAKSRHSSANTASDGINIGMIGAGNFARTHIIPHLQTYKRKASLALRAVATSGAASAKSAAELHGFGEFTTDMHAVIERADVNAVVVCSRHDSHAVAVIACIKAGKPVFVEKPLAISPHELSEIDTALVQAEQNGNTIMVGFNRRFSAPLTDIREFIVKGQTQRYAPLAMLYRVNTGAIPATHWTQDPAQGGRIIGEVCHFIDCMVYMTGALPVSVSVSGVQGFGSSTEATIIIMLTFADGSIGSVHYVANGDRAIPKEYFEVHCEGRSAIMENFTRVQYAEDGIIHTRTYNGDKGHALEMQATLSAIERGSPMPIPYREIHAVTRATFAAVQSLRHHRVVLLDEELSL
jgi:predicted dehydrogenase/threonine dehydrogenase-like Zn-dependent dehydrogenase